MSWRAGRLSATLFLIAVPVNFVVGDGAVGVVRADGRMAPGDGALYRRQRG